MLHELPLVIFTICAQMSVGSFVALGLIQLFAVRVPPATMEKVTRPALYAIGPLLVLGLAASTLHLGSPMRAINALRHFDGSWLSREIVAGIAFAGLGAVFAVLEWFRWGSYRLRQLLAAVTAIVGVVLVYCISQVYSLRTVPAWATPHTVVRFYVTTFLLGGLAVGAVLVITAFWRARRASPDEDSVTLLTSAVRGIALGSILALGVKFVGLPMYLSYLANQNSVAAQESLRILGEVYGPWSTAQTVLIFLGVAALAYLLYRLAGGHAGKRLLPAVALVAFALVLTGEVIGRMLFYASMVRIGI